MKLTDEKIWNSKNASLCWVFANWVTYEEGEVKHINGVWRIPKHLQLVGSKNIYNAHQKWIAHVQNAAL